jgi:nicotinamide riboside transporter PnuC
MTIYEIIGWLAFVGAVGGAVMNNHKLRACFLVWIIANVITAALHVRGYVLGDGAMLPLVVRDVLFTMLSIHGWYAWGRSRIPKDRF